MLALSTGLNLHPSRAIMQHTEFEPELAYALRHAANFYRMSTAKYIRTKLQQAVDELAEANPLYREIIETKP
jgi:hypothetical protein